MAQQAAVQTHNTTYFLIHYLTPSLLIPMILTAVMCIGIVVGVIFLYCRVLTKRNEENIMTAYYENDMEYPVTERAFFLENFLSLTERFFELIFSSTFVFLFVAIYFSIDHFHSQDAGTFWADYNGIILLIFILAAAILNSWMDSRLIPLQYVDPDEILTMRLLGMFYMFIVFVFIKFFHNDSNYDTIIMYFVTLVIGRFVCFDATFESFKEDMGKTVHNLPVFGLALMCTGIMAWFGFRIIGFLVTENGVVFNLFLAHVILIIIIYFVHHIALSRAKREDEYIYYDENDDSKWM